MKLHHPKGFTVIELLIATTAFSVVLAVTLSAFIQMGRLFYKGLTITQTQQVTRDILDDATAETRFAASLTTEKPAGFGILYHCVGSARYSYVLFNPVDLANHNFDIGPDPKFGLIKDTLPDANSCAAPSGTSPLKNPRELLDNRMRLGAFDIRAVANYPNLYNINLMVAYGDDEVLEGEETKDPTQLRCDGPLFSSQYCTVNRIFTTVTRGFAR